MAAKTEQFRFFLECDKNQIIQEYLQPATHNQVPRKFMGFSDTQLLSCWVDWCENWLANCGNDVLRRELNDVSAELWFRNLIPPYTSISVDCEVIQAEIDKRFRDPERREVITAAYEASTGGHVK